MNLSKEKSIAKLREADLQEIEIKMLAAAGAMQENSPDRCSAFGSDHGSASRPCG